MIDARHIESMDVFKRETKRVVAKLTRSVRNSQLPPRKKCLAPGWVQFAHDIRRPSLNFDHAF